MVRMEQWLKYSKMIALQVQSGMEENGLTQKQLAQRMGCSQQHVSALLKGSSNLTLETIARIEKALGVDLIGSAITHVRGYENSNLYHPVLNEPEAPKYGKTAKARGDGGRTVRYPIGVPTFEDIECNESTFDLVVPVTYTYQHGKMWAWIDDKTREKLRAFEKAGGLLIWVGAKPEGEDSPL